MILTEIKNDMEQFSYKNVFLFDSQRKKGGPVRAPVKHYLADFFS